jgi:putative component of membrane protein insertase Oxa1/YidC/SpoIIIJ protein YidD
MAFKFLQRTLSKYFGYRKLKPQGRLTMLLHLAKPFVAAVNKLKLGFILDFITDQFIQSYQKHLSPVKGFSCAYSKQYGTESCSEYFRKVVRRHGLSRAIPLLEKRLKYCKLANTALREQYLIRKQLHKDI